MEVTDPMEERVLQGGKMGVQLGMGAHNYYWKQKNCFNIRDFVHYVGWYDPRQKDSPKCIPMSVYLTSHRVQQNKKMLSSSTAAKHAGQTQ